MHLLRMHLVRMRTGMAVARGSMATMAAMAALSSDPTLSDAMHCSVRGVQCSRAAKMNAVIAARVGITPSARQRSVLCHCAVQHVF
jgi:hypothetical protein|mmetsp:Transcript_56953/g.127171  ORF Transcript_56953/g.127171 Transcript_56953/m.127171 type:complete len:86 (-) Transcript_56953:280-537(-)